MRLFPNYQNFEPIKAVLNADQSSSPVLYLLCFVEEASYFVSSLINLPLFNPRPKGHWTDQTCHLHKINTEILRNYQSFKIKYPKAYFGLSSKIIYFFIDPKHKPQQENARSNGVTKLPLSL